MTWPPKRQTASPSRPVNLRKVYHRGSEDIVAVDDISLTVRKGEFVSFIGPSGSGKTTLINILGCLDNPTSGTLTIGQREVFADCKGLSESDLTRIRRQVFGYIFQKFYLVPTLTVYENVVLPFAFFAEAGCRRPIPWSRSGSSAWTSGRRTGRRSYRAARCSGWPSPGP